MSHTLSFQHLAPEYIQRFQAYIPSNPDDELKKRFGCTHLFRLNNNENPLGPCPSAARVIRNFAPCRAAVYPSGDCWHLRRKLAERYNMEPDQFLFGNGANEVIAFVIKAFCRQGDNIITAEKTFAVYEWVAEFSGFEARMAPLKDHAFDDDAMIRCIDDRTKILFVCNPNNPTGTYWNDATLRSFLDRIDGRQIVVVDEAYCEFVEKLDFPDGMALISEYPNLVVFRTFSKMHALAGLRIGYLAGSREVVNIVRRTCVVYSVNALAQAAALAVLNDSGEHVQQTRDLVRRQKQVITEHLDSLGLTYLSGEGNFVMIRLPMSDSLAYRRLMMQGVMIRTMTGFRFPNWIRLTLAMPDAMDAFMAGLENILKFRNPGMQPL
jgi:histidinol-phosphate aminotransferase